MVKAIDNIKAWAKENVQLITILPENTILKVDTRLKDVLETSVDEKYYLSDEKTALLIAQLEEKDKVAGTIGHHPFSKKFEFSGYNSEISPTLLATDYKAPKTVLEEGLLIREATKQGYALAVEGDAVNFQFPNSQTRRGRVGKQIANTLEASGVNQGVVELQQYSDGEGISYNIDANYAKGTSVGDIGKGRRTHVLESEIAVPVLTPDRANKRQNGRRFTEDGEPSFTLTAQDKHGVAILRPVRTQYGKEIRRLYENGEINESRHNMTRLEPKDDGISNTITTVQKDNLLLEKKVLRIRKLTPRECFRLQSFPDRAFDKAAEVNSNSQLYRQAGNSVTVNVIHEIAKRL